MAHVQQQRHHRLSRRAPTVGCVLYTSPSINSVQPVYTAINLTWNTTCLPSFTAATADLYLSVVEPNGLVAVKLWSAIDFKAGVLSTQLSPVWWNASTGAGSIQAQLAFTGTGSPIWDTSAPSSPLFKIEYNGTYPAIATGTGGPAYVGPTIESSASAPSISGGALGAAIAVPVIILGLAIAAYVLWKRKAKQPEKKRWSAAIEKRMSMMSEGTWQPPRPSMSSMQGGAGERPFSRYSLGPNGGAPSANSPLRTSQFYADGRPASAYSMAHSPNSNNGEMRQVGSGDRVSRISFMGGERPLTGVGGKARSSIYGNRNSTSGARPATIRNSMPNSDDSPSKLLNRSATSEELSNEAFAAFVASTTSPMRPATPTRRDSTNGSLRSNTSNMPAVAMMDAKRSHKHEAEQLQDRSADSLLGSPESDAERNDANESGSPFADTHSSEVAAAAPTSSSEPAMMSSHMPMAARDSMIMSPDEALRSYAVKRDAAAAAAPSLPPNTTLKSKPSLSFLSVPKLVRSASSFLKRSKSTSENDAAGQTLASAAATSGTSSNVVDHADVLRSEGKGDINDDSVHRPTGNHYTDNDSYNITTATAASPELSPSSPTMYHTPSSTHSRPSFSASDHARESYTNPRPSPPLPPSAHSPTFSRTPILPQPAPTPTMGYATRTRSPVDANEEAGVVDANPEGTAAVTAEGGMSTLQSLSSIYSDENDELPRAR